MRAQRIKTGFHRIGMVSAGVPLFAAAAGYLVGVLSQEGIAILIGAAVALYAAAWAMGWIVAGFAGDGDRGAAGDKR